MPKIYIIIKGSGEYSYRIEEPVRAYLDKAKAQEVMASLDIIEKSYSHMPYKDREKREKACTQEYEAIGFEADAYDDWKLAEVELVE